MSVIGGAGKGPIKSFYEGYLDFGRARNTIESQLVAYRNKLNIAAALEKLEVPNKIKLVDAQLEAGMAPPATLPT